MSSRPVYRMCAQMAPSGECIRGYKPVTVVCSRLAPRTCGSFLSVLNPVVIPGLHVSICCAVLRGSLYVCMYYLCNSVRLLCWIKRRLLL